MYFVDHFSSGLPYIRQLRRNLNRDQRAAPRIANHADPRLVAIKHIEPLLHVFHADASAAAFERRGWAVAHADAVVSHLDAHAVSFQAAAQGDRSAVDARL